MADSSKHFYLVSFLLENSLFCICKLPTETSYSNKSNLSVTFPKVVKLNFLNLTTSCDASTKNTTCGSDWVEVRSASNLLDIGGPRYCCSSIPPDLYFENSEILILFYSKFLQTQPTNGFSSGIGFTISQF